MIWNTGLGVREHTRLSATSATGKPPATATTPVRDSLSETGPGLPFQGCRGAPDPHISQMRAQARNAHWQEHGIAGGGGGTMIAGQVAGPGCWGRCTCTQ